MASILSKLFGKQYTIGDLMNIDAGRQERAAGCIVSHVATFHELKKETTLDKFKSLFVNKGLLNVYYVIFKFNVKSATGGSHTVFIRVNPDFDLVDYGSNKVKIYCGCADFKFRSAYLLNKNESLFLNDRLKTNLGQALGDAPKSKTKTSLLCKHSYAALNWLVSNYAALMRTI